MNAINRYVGENPLGKRVLAYILLCSTSLAFVATGLQLYINYSKDMSGLELRMADVQRSYPDTIAQSLWNVDTPQLRVQLEGIARLPDIVDVRILGPNQDIIHQVGTLPQTELTTTRTFPLLYHRDGTSQDAQFLGTLAVTASTQQIYDQLLNTALIILATQATKTTIVAFFALFIFHRFISRHLSTLATFARRLDLKNLGDPLTLARKHSKNEDELDVVVSAINFMTTSIKHDYNEIEKYRAHLEQLVEQRTQALAQKVDEKEAVIQTLHREVIERKAAEREAHDNENRYRQLVEMSPDAIVIENDDGIVFFNSNTLELLRAREAAQLHKRSILDFIPVEWYETAKEYMRNTGTPGARLRPFECTLLRFDGSTVDVEISRAIFQYQGAPAVQTVIHDITKFKHYEAQLRKQALHDALTGLPNRTLLTDRIEHEITRAAREKTSVYVLFLDLDRFKYINDSLGHDAGDELLRAFAAKMTTCLRKSDTLARLGGDEFVLVLGNLPNESTVSVITEKLLKKISEPIVVRDREIILSCSIGWSVYPRDGHNATTLLKRADSAMYRAKEQGGNGIRQYTIDLHDRADEHLMMESGLRHALGRGELLLHYQPLLELHSGKVVAAEALIRWQHPEIGMILPGRFIPLAEETGLISSIGEWVIRTACRQAKQWQESKIANLRVSVNLSVHQLMRPNLEQEIEGILQETGLSPEHLALEITESISMVDPERIAIRLDKLKAMGISLAIDDFGTGYSNLSYLKRFPVDHIKLDRVFVKDIGREHLDAMLVQAIVDVAHNLKMKVVAEGVEDVDQAAQLASYGCDEAQGYLFSPPLPVDAFAEMLEQLAHQKTSSWFARWDDVQKLSRVHPNR